MMKADARLLTIISWVIMHHENFIDIITMNNCPELFNVTIRVTAFIIGSNVLNCNINLYNIMYLISGLLTERDG